MWYGVMITTILEVLVAVVVLIVIIAVAALHFLRADDSDTFDDMADEPRQTRPHPAEPALDQALVPAVRGRSRRPEAAREQRAAAERTARPSDDRGQPGYRDRDGGGRDGGGRDGGGRDGKSRPARPERRSDPIAGGPRPVPAAARQAKAARPADADSATSSWDKLSDVDYWAEVASDKPLSPAAAASPDSPRAARRGAAQKADAARSADRTAPRGEPGQLPVRQRSQSRPGPTSAPRPADPGQTEQIDVRAARAGGRYGAETAGRYGAEPATQSLAALARLGDQPPVSPQPPVQAPRAPSGQRPATGPRPAANGRPAGGQRSAGGGQRPVTGQRPAQPAYPPAPAPQVSHSGGHGRPLPMDDDPLTSPSFPAINTSDSRSYRTRRPASSPYPAAPDRSASVPGGYPAQPAPAPAAGPAHAAAPVANPYGSYVSTPPPGYQEPSTSHLDATAYGSGYAAGQQAVADANWYGSTPNGSQAVNGYLPAPASGNGASGYGASGYSASGNGASGYGANGALGNNGYSAADYSYQSPPYGQHDQQGHGAPDLGYGQDGYQGYPGYGGGAR